jgi:Methyltransferase domain
MSLRSLLRDLLPAEVKHGIGRLLAPARRRRLSQLPIQEAFDEVYRRGLWKTGDAYSGPGSEGLLADRYVALVQDYAAKHKLRTVVDAGCGDFVVGSRLASSFDRYTALDVSPLIIEINKRRYVDLNMQHVSFGVADMTSTAFPQADLILIRQVLQHLTNAQIERILSNLEASEWRRALITEDVCRPGNNPIPNLDMPSHSARTRIPLGSGVFIDEPPFNRAAKRLAVIHGAPAGEEPKSGLLVFELARDDVA